MFDQLFKMALEERERQNGEFLPKVNASTYWDKIKNKAEFNVHVVNGEYAGFVAFYCNNEQTKESFITLIMVSPEFRGKKIGAGLVDYVLSVSKSRGFSVCSLEVKKKNKSAISLYQIKGFSISEEREDTFIMKKYL